ncbi:MAG: diadenylate cyclase CdaA [Calditrichaceae bacterium]|nr:diadenylate cyclase CdaA [Calditrichaceae bacterium]MBN2709209.1 diadenylate cyclase CdaA [Calditrichaceae bacterium]RQV96164.1 MAG: TIGR00159 family protein [Calditrichota bacterium]
MLFRIGFLPVTLIDIIDVAIVTAIFYELYQFLKGSVAIRMFIGLFVIIVFSIIGELLSMRALTWIMSSLKTVWVLAFVIIFQPELRRLLVHIGQSRLIRTFVKVGDLRFIDDIIAAVLELAKKNFGALIVIKRDMGLKSIVESGISLQAKISKQLISSVFNPRSPMHDGALVIENDLIVASKCLLPLSQSQEIDPALGTRHRAALGISEQSDAFVIVVSEETGMISYAENGKLTRGITEEILKEKMNEIYSPKSIERSRWWFGFAS